jgi:hypothetical protein
VSLGVNADKPQLWKADIAASVDLYNSWFLNFAPKAYRDERVSATSSVEEALTLTNNLADITPAKLREHPTVLPMLRMSTAPPIARDRLIGLAAVSPSLVRTMELTGRVPEGRSVAAVDGQLNKIGEMIARLVDVDIFPWFPTKSKPRPSERHRAATIVADRLCGSRSDPIIRNAQEARQLRAIRVWLEAKGYKFIGSGEGLKYDSMQPGTFGFRVNVPVKLNDGSRTVNIPIDVAIKRKASVPADFPLLIEAKSAGDFTNTNKRRKEEAQKISQLRDTYGSGVRFVLFLCGYFDSGYLGYEAAEGIDWVWEHRMDDLVEFGV